MAKALLLIFFVIGSVAWAVTFGVYAFANPDMAENENIDCWARSDFYLPVQPATYEMVTVRVPAEVEGEDDIEVKVKTIVEPTP
jgi:hypothetical protein